MHLGNSNYELKNRNENIFKNYFNYEFQIDAFTNMENDFVFSSKTEVFLLRNKICKKIADVGSKITKLFVSEALIYVGINSGELLIYTAGKTCVGRYSAHSGMITGIKKWNDKILTSGMDGKIAIYDIQNSEPVHIINHGNPITAIEIAENTVYFSASTIFGIDLITFEEVFTSPFDIPCANEIVLDGSNLIYTENNSIGILNIDNWNITSKICHTKKITLIEIHNGLIYSGSLDGHFKTWNGNLQNINNFKFADGIAGISIFEKKPFICLQKGSLLTFPKEKEPKEPKRSKIIKLNDYEEETEYTLLKVNMKIKSQIERMISNFQYKKAFRTALSTGDIEQIYSVLKTLQISRSLKHLLIDQTETELIPIIELIIDNYRLPEFTAIFNECMIIITSIYEPMILNSKELLTLIEIFSQIVDEDLVFYEKLIQSIGFLSCFEE